MAKLTNHHAAAMLRSAKPRVQPDEAFVQRLQIDLQRQAVQQVSATVQPTPKRSVFSNWFGTFSLVGAGALAVVAAFLVLPDWLNPAQPIQGYIQKGPFISGSTITIQELDDRLQPSGNSYQVTTASDFGDYRLTQDISSNYVEVIAQGYYFDEVAGALSSGPLTLRAIADVSENKVVNVNVLTTLIAPRLRHIVIADGIALADAKKIAEQEVLHVFQITGQVATNFENMNISQAGADNGVLLAVSVLLQGQQSVAELSELLSKLSLAIRTDGTVATDGPLLQTIRDNAASLKTKQITDHLEQRFSDLGVMATVPNFGYLLKPFLDNADAFAYRITLQDNMFGVNRTAGATIKVTIFGNDFVAEQEVVSLKETVEATSVTYVNDHTLIAEFPIAQLSPGAYTVVVRNTATGRLGTTDGDPLPDDTLDLATTRLVLRGPAPSINGVSGEVSYLTGGTIELRGQHFAYGTFVWINGWQVPQAAIRITNDHLLHVDLSPALIADNPALPRRTPLTITVQTPDFQTTDYSGFQIQ